MDKESGRKQKGNEDRYVSDKRRRKREREGREQKNRLIQFLKFIVY